MASRDDFVFRKFADYYRTSLLNLHEPSRIREREFGFITFGKAMMLRHKKFETKKELESFLGSMVPSAAYHSSAYYERPQAEMDEKGWRGADLVFDIDVDHIPTPCGKIHDRWTCSNCGFAGKGPTPERCPACGEARFDAKTWTCDVCLETAKEETAKLLDFLMDDFGFANDELNVYFSGNRGYHVHVERDRVRLLDSMARKELVDYIIGLGLKTESHRLIDRGGIVVGADLTGWRRRIVRGIERFLENASAGEVGAQDLSKRSVESLVKNKEMHLENLKKRGRIDVKGVGPQNWEKIVHWVVDQQSAKIDTVVTTDIHRLIRLAGSLHGKTGFMKVEAPLRGLDEFDPLKEAVAFKEGRAIVDVSEAPEFRIGDTVYGPFRNASSVELPTSAAVFLLCKGVAQVVA